MIISILQIVCMSGNYTFELIEEFITKYVIFDIIDFNAFKIFKYIPQCEESTKHNKNINVQIVMDYVTMDLYFYDNFNDIEQDVLGIFVNYTDSREIFWRDDYTIESFSNLTCGKEYFFVTSLTSNYIKYNDIYFQFSVIDTSIDKIKISPVISDRFTIIARKSKEIIEYSHNETKYASFFFSYITKVTILKNNEVIYDKKEKEPSYIDPVEFEKNQNYSIYFEGNGSPLISIQLFNEPKFFKVDLNKGPISLFYRKYYYEIDISNYQLNDIILFKMESAGNYRFSYQYKKELSGNRFIDIGQFGNENYIPIKKTVDDTSLILYIEFHQLSFSILFIIKDIEEIKSEIKKEVIGPKYYYIDNFEFNNINSIGIAGNDSFFIYEQEQKQVITSKYVYQNLYITKTKNSSPEIFNKTIIKINSNKAILFEIKKFNYPIFLRYLYSAPNDEFFQLCQGENPSNELYFYVEENFIHIRNELFIPVFGTFYSYYIIEEDIHNLLELDFEKREIVNYYQIYDKTGYLKIKCKEPTMVKHFNFYYDERKDVSELNSGRKYYIDDYDIRNRTFTFNNTLINNDLNIKITIYGIEPEKSIKLILNNNVYIYTNNNNSHEFNIKYEKKMFDLFHFELEEEIENLLIGEIIVGILPKDIKKMFRQIDFEDIFGNLTLQEKEGVMIKIPKNFTEELYDFSIIFPAFNSIFNSYSNNFYIDISYDKLELITKYNKKNHKDVSPVIPLFQVNPYNYIKDNSINSNEKYLYIYIINEYNYEQNIYIKKPIIYSDVKFNKLNVLPQLKEKDSIYYYQLKIPEPKDNNYIYVQNKRAGFPQKMSYSKNNILFPILDKSLYTYYNIPYDKRDKNSVVYLHFYDVQDNPGYINFIETNEHIYRDYSPLTKLNLTAVQLEGKNKLRIKLNSLSYTFYPDLVKYYFIINMEDNYGALYSIISGQKKPDKSKFQFMSVVEDNGAKEIFQRDIKIDIDLKGDYFKSNNIYCIPVNTKTNLIELNYIEYISFEYKNLSFYQKHEILIWSIVISILFIIVAIGIIAYFYFKRRKKSSLEKNILNISLSLEKQ